MTSHDIAGALEFAKAVLVCLLPSLEICTIRCGLKHGRAKREVLVDFLDDVH
jgi:hypothetical protein